MKNSKTLFRDFIAALTVREREEEKETIASLVFENVLGLTRTRILAGEEITLTPGQTERLREVTGRINRHEPLQYILGEAGFYGRVFRVTDRVLIPRPETEMLIEVVKEYVAANPGQKPKCLDIGTGSGCIPVTLKLEIPQMEVYASDVSPEALDVARKNAALHKAEVSFMQHDILKASLPFGRFNAIISNPPYITEKEMGEMSPNVLDHEPHLALFVPDDDPLLFYKPIVSQSKNALVRGGLLAAEINENFGGEVKNLFEANGFAAVEIVKDLFSKERIVKGIKA